MSRTLLWIKASLSASASALLAWPLALGLWLGAHTAAAQITPPGLGNAKTAAWSALGLNASLGPREWSYLGYVGVGTTSARQNHSPYDRPAILVINHEVYDQFQPHWRYSVGLSYRRQNAYRGEGSEWEEERLQELRLYARYALILEKGPVKFQATLRPEVRGFARPNFAPAQESLQLRARFKAQLAWKLDAPGKHRIIGGAEALAATSRMGASFAPFRYRESRFSVFYSVHSDERFVVDVGYMTDLIGDGAPFLDVHYLAIDLIWSDPFERGSSDENES